MASSPSIPRRRWRIALLLGFGVLVNYFDRVNLSVSQDALAHDFGITLVTFGWLAAAYNFTYAALQLPIGFILDKFGIRRVGRVSIFLWSLASFAAALSPGLKSLFAARLLLGVGEAPTFPANGKAIGSWFPPHERSFATAINDSMAKLASAIGVPVLGILLLHIGWRMSFAATGIISLAYFALFWGVYTDPQHDTGLSDQERAYITGLPANATPGPRPPTPRFLSLLANRKTIALMLGFGAYNYTFYLLLTWLPKYLSSTLGIDLAHAFLYTGVPWLVAAITDLLIGGWLADFLIQRGANPNTVRKTILALGLACGMGIFGAAYAHTAVSAVLWISLSIGGVSAAAPIGWSIPSLIAPRQSVGAVGGIANFSSQVSAIAAPVITGYAVQSLHSFVLAFSIAAAYLAAGIFGYLVLMGPIEPMTLPAE